MKFSVPIFLSFLSLGSSLALPTTPHELTPRQKVDPSTCPNVRCIGNYRPAYHPELGRCICEPLPVNENPGSDAEKFPVQALATKDLDPNDLSKCQGQDIFCLAIYRLVYHPKLGTCTCDPLPENENPQPVIEDPPIPELETRVPQADNQQCQDLYCLAIYKLVYHPELGTCTCDPLPENESSTPVIEGTPAPELESRDPAAVPQNGGFCPAVLCPDGSPRKPSNNCKCPEIQSLDRDLETRDPVAAPQQGHFCTADICPDGSARDPRKNCKCPEIQSLATELETRDPAAVPQNGGFCPAVLCPDGSPRNPSNNCRCPPKPAVGH